MDFESTRLYFVDVLPICNFFIRAVWVFLFLTEDCLDFVVQLVTAVSYEQDLEGLLNSDAALESLVVHEELHQIK